MSTTRRSYGTGSLEVRTDGNGIETWYGRWHANGRRKKVKIGLKRTAGQRDGLTITQAEAELRRRIAETTVHAPAGERLTVEDVARRYMAHAERRGRKPSTIANVESETRIHLAPYFAGRSLDAITPDDVIGLVGVLEGRGLAPKTVKNIVATLSALFNYAKAPQRRWATWNPCEGIDLQAVPEAVEIRFLTMDEVDLLIAHARPGDFQRIDRAIFLCAAMTGLRRGELIALRWMDVDWPAQRIRVRRNYVMGQFGTPKSKRSTRSVPMADELAGELERLFQASTWQADEDLVFAHPHTGDVLPAANVSRRMRAALKAAGLDDTHRFHDLRHSAATRMAAAGVPIRTLQEWMGHRDITTTQRYADYAPSAHEVDMVTAAFARGPVHGPNLTETQSTSEHLTRDEMGL